MAYAMRLIKCGAMTEGNRMPTVFAQPTWNAPLRIRTPEPGGGSAAAPARENGDLYLSRLVKLVPSEVVALYLTFKATAETWLGVWATVCLGLVVLTRAVGTHESGKPVQVGAVLVSMVSFTLWVYATGGQLLSLELPASPPGLISVAIGVWTFLVPLLYKGD